MTTFQKFNELKCHVKIVWEKNQIKMKINRKESIAVVKQMLQKYIY